MGKKIKKKKTSIGTNKIFPGKNPEHTESKVNESRNKNSISPKVTVFIPTFNRPNYLKDAISSVLKQTFSDWEIILINDGGVDVREIAESYHDSRIRYFNREKNTGKAACLNFGLKKAKGQYIAYLDDDDMWYPNHLQTLAKALDEHPDIGLVYSDLYAVNFIKDEDTGVRYPLHKEIQVSRDFNRDFMMYTNHTVHVSLMHRKYLLENAGGYDEKVTVYIDWNMARKLMFYTDFLHISEITGEYYMPLKGTDRISNLERRDNEKFKHNMRKIKADLPPLPWPKVQKVAVVFPVFEWTDFICNLITDFVDCISYPVIFIIVNNDPEKNETACRQTLGIIGELKNIKIYSPGKSMTKLASYRFGAIKANADYLYLPSEKADAKFNLRLLRALWHINKTKCIGLKWDIEQEKEGVFDIFIKKSDFLEASDAKNHDKGITLDVIFSDYFPETFWCDYLITMADECIRNGDKEKAYEFVQKALAINEGGATEQFLMGQYLQLFFDLHKYDEVEEKSRKLIEKGFKAHNWIMLGKVLQYKKRLDEAIESYEKGLMAIGIEHADLLNSSAFPIYVDKEFDAFTALIGMGECFFEKRDLGQAARMFRKASKLKGNSHLPFLGFSRLFLEDNDIKRAKEAIDTAVKMVGPEHPDVQQIMSLLNGKNI